MFENEAEVLLQKMLEKIKKISDGDNPSIPPNLLKKLIDNLEFELNPFHGLSDATKGIVSLPIDKRYLTRDGLTQDVSFSYVLFHELGHQVLPLLNASEKQLNHVLSEYQKQRGDSFSYDNPEHVETYLESTNDQFSLFRNPKIKDFQEALRDTHTQKLHNSYDAEELSMSKGFVVRSEHEATLLSQYSFKLRSVFHEQFADAFALSLVRKIYPSQYEDFVVKNIASRKNMQDTYAQSRNDSMMSDFEQGIIGNEAGYVHSTARSNTDINAAICNDPKKLKTLSDIVDTIYPIIEKNVLIEMKEAMSEQKLLVYFPSALNTIINDASQEDVTNTTSKIDAIRKKSAGAKIDVDTPKM